MTQEEELAKLADLLDVDELTPEKTLNTLPWDSMAMLGVIAWARSNGVKITGDMLKQMRTVEDVLTAVKGGR